jgi:hypothetical protein
MKTLKNAKNLSTGLLLLTALVVGCGGGKPAPPKYQGNWVGADGSTLYLENDGRAGFKVGAKTVTGGAAEFDEAGKTFTISLFGISHTFEIDAEPNEKGEMTLNGVVYRKR